MERFGSLHYMIACIIKSQDSLNLWSLCTTCSFPTRSWVTNPAVTHAITCTFCIDFVQHLLKGCLNSLAPFLLLLFFLSGLLGKILWQLPQCLPYHLFLTAGLCIPVLELQRYNKIKETVIKCCTSEGTLYTPLSIINGCVLLNWVWFSGSYTLNRVFNILHYIISLFSILTWTG